MDNDRPLNKKRCEAMVEAGVYDPEKREGIDFCVNHCPYTFCVVMENDETIAQRKKRRNSDLAIRLRVHRVTIEDIALILHASSRNVHRWLKDK